MYLTFLSNKIWSWFKLIALHYFLIREILVKKFPLYEKKKWKEGGQKNQYWNFLSQIHVRLF